MIRLEPDPAGIEHRLPDHASVTSRASDGGAAAHGITKGVAWPRESLGKPGSDSAAADDIRRTGAGSSGTTDQRIADTVAVQVGHR